MSWEEFELVPAHPGWKQEYWDGVAHITPSARFAAVRLDVELRPIQTPLRLRAVTGPDESALVLACLDAFRESVEYCDWEQDAIFRSARENVQAFGAGIRGEVLSASCLAIDPTVEDPAGAIAGAALLVRTKDRIPMLDMLFVRPRWQRRGLATALVCWSLDSLHRRGEVILRSRYHLANEPSQAWHRKFGFAEEPDLLLAQLYLRCARQELRRKEKMGGLGEEERRGLLLKEEACERLVEELERIATEQGMEAVSPTLL
jgi:GNAT superfamily N-acetyltransferase